jgi:hypothetical protein
VQIVLPNQIVLIVQMHYQVLSILKIIVELVNILVKHVIPLHIVYLVVMVQKQEIIINIVIAKLDIMKVVMNVYLV